MITMPTDRSRHVLVIALAAVVLGVVSTVVLAAARPTIHARPFAEAPARCEVPALPGTAVDVTLADMPGIRMGHCDVGTGTLRADLQYRRPLLGRNVLGAHRHWDALRTISTGTGTSASTG